MREMRGKAQKKYLEIEREASDKFKHRSIHGCAAIECSLALESTVVTLIDQCDAPPALIFPNRPTSNHPQFVKSFRLPVCWPYSTHISYKKCSL